MQWDTLKFILFSPVGTLNQPSAWDLMNCVFTLMCQWVCGFFLALEDYGKRIWDNNRGVPWELPVSWFLWWVVLTLGLDSIVSPLPLHQVKGECLFSCNLPPALLPEPPLFNTVPKILGSCFGPEWGVLGKRVFNNVLLLYHGMDEYQNRSQHTKCTQENIIPLLLHGIEPPAFQSRAWHSTTQQCSCPYFCPDNVI